jgi:hypothetical protein
LASAAQLSTSIYSNGNLVATGDAARLMWIEAWIKAEEADHISAKLHGEYLSDPTGNAARDRRMVDLYAERDALRARLAPASSTPLTEGHAKSEIAAARPASLPRKPRNAAARNAILAKIESKEWRVAGFGDPLSAGMSHKTTLNALSELGVGATEPTLKRALRELKKRRSAS